MKATANLTKASEMHANEHNAADMLIRSISERIKSRFNPQKVILFGSRAVGDAEKNSDIDILVIVETDESVKKLAWRIRNELESTVPIDILVRTPRQIDTRLELGDFFIRDIIEKGIPL